MQQERRSKIIQRIRQNRMVKVTDLMREHGVSIETVRRDLEYLEQQGYLKRVYGGAVLSGLYTKERDQSLQEGMGQSEEKRAIAQVAAELITDGDTLFVDVGATTLEVVSRLGHKRGLTIITNALPVAQEAVRIEGCRVIMLGGMVRAGELSVAGHLCDESLRGFYANKAVLGVGGITLENGITDRHYLEAATRRLMVERSDFVIAVADSSKFGQIAMNQGCPLEQLGALVTDWAIPVEVAEAYRAKGVNLRVAPPPMQ